MSVATTDTVLQSDMSDLQFLSFDDSETGIDDVEYAHIMRRIGIAEGEPGTSVSAFNSHI
jgi:hypothetical protein